MKKVFAIILGCIGLILAIVALVLSFPYDLNSPMAMLGLAIGLLGVIIALPKDPQ
jgi:uncharacterized membrane protein YccC